MQEASLNRPVWARSTTVHYYEAAQGFCDEGERVLYQSIAEKVRGQPILDLGVGAGRTVPLLEPLASRYVALDYVPEMVEACKKRFPNIDVSVGDGRHLERFEDGSFGLVMFSFNGLDCVGHEDRARVLAEIHRVLRPGGYFCFSTLNLDGIGRRIRPWRPEWPRLEGSWARFTLDTLRTVARIPTRMLNHERLRSQFASGDGWRVETISAHDFALLVHYTTLRRALAELEAAGFEPNPVVVESGHGNPVSVDDDPSEIFWFQFLARKPQS